jgi:hypothetical protein
MSSKAKNIQPHAVGRNREGGRRGTKQKATKTDGDGAKESSGVQSEGPGRRELPIERAPKCMCVHERDVGGWGVGRERGVAIVLIWCGCRGRAMGWKERGRGVGGERDQRDDDRVCRCW